MAYHMRPLDLKDIFSDDVIEAVLAANPRLDNALSVVRMIEQEVIDKSTLVGLDGRRNLLYNLCAKIGTLYVYIPQPHLVKMDVSSHVCSIDQLIRDLVHLAPRKWFRLPLNERVALVNNFKAQSSYHSMYRQYSVIIGSVPPNMLRSMFCVSLSLHHVAGPLETTFVRVGSFPIESPQYNTNYCMSTSAGVLHRTLPFHYGAMVVDPKILDLLISVLLFTRSGFNFASYMRDIPIETENTYLSSDSCILKNERGTHALYGSDMRITSATNTKGYYTYTVVNVEDILSMGIEAYESTFQQVNRLISLDRERWCVMTVIDEWAWAADMYWSITPVFFRVRNVRYAEPILVDGPTNSLSRAAAFAYEVIANELRKWQFESQNAIDLILSGRSLYLLTEKFETMSSSAHIFEGNADSNSVVTEQAQWLCEEF
jgi:hypothetical protein